MTLSIPSCIDFHCGCKNTLQFHTQTHDGYGITCVHALTDNEGKKYNVQANAACANND